MPWPDASMTSVLIKRGNVDTEAHKRKTRWRHRENASYKPKKAWEHILPQSLQKQSTMLTPWSWIFSLQNWETTHFSDLSPQFVVLCYNSPRKLIEPQSRETNWSPSLGRNLGQWEGIKNIIELKNRDESDESKPSHRVPLSHQRSGTRFKKVNLGSQLLWIGLFSFSVNTLYLPPPEGLPLKNSVLSLPLALMLKGLLSTQNTLTLSHQSICTSAL